ncbi:bactofilin family protein [Massilibacteroides vaginae]|uniref:bactofilin family protein n=1 Tax=Massilibacteroides vaginae TaxID=1673718 RepID=UPI000A1CF0FD|nr:polymer-forming cytoskeletal protein [Massilibacteroides vaginae]
MIRNKNNPEAIVGGLHNTLAIGTKVKGDIILDIDFRLDGCIEGNIKCGAKIVVGPKAQVNGNIESVNAEIAGTLAGTIRASEKLIVKSTADITGDIFTKILEIEPNAKVNGSCNMSADAVKK